MSLSVIIVDPEIQSGAPVFVGTRVPVKNLFDYLEAGDSLDVFLEEFPSVTREMAISALQEARSALLDEHAARIEKGATHEEDDPFATFSEWASEADEEAYGNR